MVPGVDLNYRHADFQSAALPLSYPGTSFGYLNLTNLSNSNYPETNSFNGLLSLSRSNSKEPPFVHPQILFLIYHLEKNSRLNHILFFSLIYEHGKKSIMILPPIPKTFINRQISLHASKFSSLA